MAGPIKQRRRNLHLQRFPTLHQIHHRRILDRCPTHQLRSRLSQFPPRRQRILILRRIFHQRRSHLHLTRQQLSRPLTQRRIDRCNLSLQRRELSAMYIPSCTRSRIPQLLPQPPHFPMRIRKQPRNLRLQSARIHNLAQRSIRRQRQQIPRYIKRPTAFSVRS